MTDGIRFHLDENVPRAIAIGLRQRNIDVTTTHDANLIGSTDAEQLAYAVNEGRIIFTQDTDFLIMASEGHSHPGIVYARKAHRSIGQIVRSLELIHGVLTVEEMVGHIEYI